MTIAKRAIIGRGLVLTSALKNNVSNSTSLLTYSFKIHYINLIQCFIQQADMYSDTIQAQYLYYPKILFQGTDLVSDLLQTTEEPLYNDESINQRMS